jgi:8-hydroxy-5-deazaflavin:NADPH oxidoreductase
MTPELINKTIAIIGGTGKEGKGLAYRLGKAGYRIIIGSREKEKAQATANELSERLKGNTSIQGTTNFEAAKAADMVVLTVPFSAHRVTLENIKDALMGKILVDVTVPLVPPAVTKVQMPAAGSAAQEALEILGENALVASAFQNISFEHLLKDDPIDCDVLVTGNGKEVRSEVLNLVEAAGLIGWDAGPIENSMVVEGLTSILIGINKNYKISSAGIKITGK